MMKRLLLIFGLYGITLWGLRAQEVAIPMKAEVSDRPLAVSHEITSDHGYVSGSKAHLGAAAFGNITEQNNSFQYVASPQLSQGTLLRVGVAWQRFSFGLPTGAPLPNTLQSASALLGADLELSDQWLMRVDIEPGIYSDFRDMSLDDINAPLILGFSCLIDENLQWFLGMSANPRRDIPVLPGAGVRWKFASQWTLIFLFPKPRIEYEWNGDLRLYFGGDIKAGTYKVARNFGDSFGRTNLNNAALDYTELRIGPGVSWKAMTGFTLDVEAGYMIYREFNFHAADIRVVNNNGAPYGQIALKANF